MRTPLLGKKFRDIEKSTGFNCFGVRRVTGKKLTIRQPIRATSSRSTALLKVTLSDANQKSKRIPFYGHAHAGTTALNAVEVTGDNRTDLVVGTFLTRGVAVVVNVTPSSEAGTTIRAPELVYFIHRRCIESVCDWMTLPHKSHGTTRNGTLLVRVPPGVVTWTNPLVAPTGTVAVINVPDRIANVAGVPLKETSLAPAKPWPRIPTVLPTLAALLTNPTNWPRPVATPNTVPSLALPVPFVAVPYKFPFVA